jgi:hypothetical protein
MTCPKDWGLPPLAGWFGSLWSVVCTMFWLVKQVLLVLVAIQLAAPAGWCCRLAPPEQFCGAVGASQAPVRRCCASHQAPAAPRPVSDNHCCCPKAATLAKPVGSPEQDSQPSQLLPCSTSFSVRTGPTFNQRFLVRSLQSHERQSGPIQAELCLWLC